ncbi:MAG: T9SS type A sorting domain-containing protein, partial [Paludibacteraceae bacterium]|nr:T9SS type A sorting domain-containing protein [Paludibacteraceae bacterium]
KLDDITSVYKYLLDGKYSESDTIFTPNLAYNGSSTRTVALLRDNLFDSISIRFPRLDTVSKDQRGVSRLNPTCMGAYEIVCIPDTTFDIRSIIVGSKFEDGKIYNNVGRYDNVISNVKKESDCDSVISYTLFVVPDSSYVIPYPSIKEYYVKTHKTGKGDGSDWDNAMGAKDFAFVFENLQTDGVTFYVAAGVYHAVYDGNGKETNDKNAHWVSQHGANIYGGYDSLTTGNATSTPNPTLYRTIFSGDLNGDDKVVMKGDCGCSFENFGDNMNTSMISMKVDCDVQISGIELTGMSFARGTSPALISLSAPIGSEYMVMIDNCKLSVADKGIQVVNVDEVHVFGCEFDYISNSAFYTNANCHVFNSTFAYTNGVICDAINSSSRIVNSTFVKNSQDVRVSDNSDNSSSSTGIYNNTFISCKNGGNLVVGDNVSASVVGNIFAGTPVSIIKSNYEARQQSFANNLFASKNLNLGETVLEEGNIKLDDITAIYKEILDGTYSESDSIFTPNLAYNESSTRTVALLRDNFSDETSIRFSRVADIDRDQRNVYRKDSTCMGAYEITKGDGVDDINSISFEIYPNPVKDVLSVIGCDGSFSYEIVDLTGRTISRGKSSGTIDVVGLSKGVYVLKLNYAEQQTCIRFVKQ